MARSVSVMGPPVSSVVSSGMNSLSTLSCHPGSMCETAEA